MIVGVAVGAGVKVEVTVASEVAAHICEAFGAHELSRTTNKIIKMNCLFIMIPTIYEFEFRFTILRIEIEFRFTILRMTDIETAYNSALVGVLFPPISVYASHTTQTLPLAQ